MVQQYNNNIAPANANIERNASNNVQQATVNNNNNDQTQQNPVATSTTTTTTTTTVLINGNTDTNTTTSTNNDGSRNNSLSAVFGQFVSHASDNDLHSTEVDENTHTNNNNNCVNVQTVSPLLSALGGESDPFASFMNVALGSTTNRNKNNNNNDGIKFLIDTLNISELNEIKLGNYKFIRNCHQVLKSFILNTILSSNDTPMHDHEWIWFICETREVIRNVTTNLFRNTI